MNNFRLIEVRTPQHIKLFHSMARALYGQDATWVEPLRHDIEGVFDPKRNKLLVEGQAARWLVENTANGEIVGRIAAFFHPQKAALEQQPTGGCGFFEAIDSQEVANLLFDTARHWLAERGMQAMDGPINFGDRMQWWGLLVEGFHEPLYGMAYARPYYAALFETYGFQNYFNQITYRRPFYTGIELPAAVTEKADRLFHNPEYEFRTFDPRQPQQMARDFCAIYNSGWVRIHGVEPLTEAGALKMIRSMGPIIDPEVLLMAYHQGEAVGFFVMLPDINQLIKPFHGRFGLIEKLRLLWGIKTKKVDRLAGLIFGVSAEFQGKGVEAAMIRQLVRYIFERRDAGKIQYTTLEMGWIGDFNPVMMRMCERYVRAEPWKRHVTYRYLFDRTAPFERCPRS